MPRASHPLTKFTFRVDEIDGVTRESVVAFLAKYNCRHVVCREVSDETHKPHYQGWVELEMSEQTWKNHIKAEWPGVKGSRGRSRGSYSAVKVKKDTYEHYILKGTPTELPDIVSQLLCVGETLDVDAIHRQWWSRHTSTAEQKKVHLVEEGIEKFSSYEWDDDDVHYKRGVVLEWLLGKYKGKGQNSFLFKNYINGILNQVCPEHREEFKRQIVYSERW